MIAALVMAALFVGEPHYGTLEELEIELAQRIEVSSGEELEQRVARMKQRLHPEARAAVEDPSPLIGILGTRRSGKSRSAITEMLDVGATVPDARVYYVNETMGECERIAWIGNGHDGLLTVNEEYELGGRANHSKHTLTFPRGGIIELIGADDMRQINKIRGGAPTLLVVDEAQKLPHVQPLLRSAAGAGMMDAKMRHGRVGRIILSGTPGDDLAGLFFEVTDNESECPAGWSRHFLNVTMNPFFGATPEERFENTVLEFCRIHGLELDAPEVQREWFGKWVRELARYTYAVHQVPRHKLVYAPPRWKEEPTWAKDKDGKELFLEGGTPDFEAARADLPVIGERGGRVVRPEWQFTLFADLGYFPDPFGYVLWAWSWEWEELLEVASWAQRRLDSDEQFRVLESVAEKFPGALVGGDIGGVATPMGKGWSKRFQDRFKYGLIEAEKHRKFEHIQLFNTDLRQGRIRVRDGSPLFHQLHRVRWLPRTATGALKEDPEIPNDITDPALYGHRYTASHRAKRKELPPSVGSPQYYEKIEAELERDDEDDYERRSYDDE